MNDLWQACASHLESELPDQLYRTWIKPLVFLGFDDAERVLKLGAPNRVKLDWVRGQYGDRITQLAGDLIGSDTRVSFEICGGTDEASGASGALTNPEIQSAMTPPARSIEPSPQTPAATSTLHAGAVPFGLSPSLTHDRSRLNPELTFSSFVTGKANDLVRAAALQVADH
ncbi:MAG: chromosomal replication initiator protein DnaA, partial [Burkholderiales bacterium]|nr:chromosomal replication initiator protein DnaA [Burkholderiales bacterium]